MASASHSKGKGKSSSHIPERPGLTSWRETSSNGPPLMLRLVQEAVTLSPITELKQAASVTLTILRSVKVVKDNKDAYSRLGDDACGLIVVIWNSYKKAEFADEWLSMEMREILEDLTHTLENICSFVQEHISKRKGIRVILGKGDAGKKISEYREHLNYAMQKFELQSQINMNDVLMQIMRQNDQLSEQILHRNEEEEVNRALEIIARDARDHELAQQIHEEEMYEEEIEKLIEISRLEQVNQAEVDCQDELSEEMKKIEEEAKDRRSELERLRAAARAVEEAKRLMEAEEKEIARLKRTLAPEKDSRRSSTVQAQSNTRNKSSREEDEIDDEQDERGGNFIVEEATSEEEAEEECPVRKPSKVKKDRSRSPKRRPIHSSDEDEDIYQHRQSPTTRTARRKPPSSLCVEEPEDESTDDEDRTPPPSRKGGKARRRPQSLPSSRRPLDVDNLIKGFIPFGFYGSHSDSHLGSPLYGSSVLFPKGHLPGTIVNSGVGNIISSTIANVGNDNSRYYESN